MILDMNVHWFPENLFTDESLLNSFISFIPRAYGEHVELTTVPGTDRKQIVIEKPKGYQNLNMTHLDVDSKDRLETMDEAKVDMAILRMPIWEEWVNLEFAKKINDLMAKYVREHYDRFRGLAIVPPWGDKDCLYEVERCVKDLGLCGVEVPAHYGDLYLDAEEFKPYFKKLNQLGVPIVIHHTPLPVEYRHLYEYTNLRRVFGRCVAQMTNLGRILFSGMLDEFPNLRFIPTFLGGGFFTFVNMLIPEKSVVQEEIERFDLVADKIRGYLKRNIYFDIAHAQWWGKAQLECAIKVLGADHVLWGSSYPVRREWLVKGPEFVQSLEIGEREKMLILGENAIRLFNIKA